MYRYGLVNKAGGSALHLVSVWIRGSIHGCASQVVTTLEYTNDDTNSIEAVYIFPLDNEVDVCGFQATVEGRTVLAVVKEKKNASNGYDGDTTNGPNDLGLSDNDERSDILQFSIGNVPSQKTVVVQLTYVSELAVGQEGCVVFRLPSALNPRYNPRFDGRGNRAGARVASVNSKYSFEFELEVQSASSIQQITSPSTQLNVEINKADRRQAAVKLTSGVYGYDSDVEVHVLSEESFQMHALIENGVTTKSSDRFLAKPVVMVNLCPEFENSSPPERGEFIFLVNQSKRMDGEKVDRAREALLLFLKSLPSSCHFNVVGFGSSSDKLFPRSEPCSDSSLEKAREFAWSMKADVYGAVDMLASMREVFSQPHIEGHPRQVIILTDEEINHAEQAIDEVKKNAYLARCFVFGIGVHDDSATLLRRMAKAGRGRAELVTSLDRIQPKVSAMMSFACQPVLRDLQLTWNLPSGWAARCIPRVIPPIYKGDRLVLYGLLMRKDNEPPQYIIAVEGKAIVSGKLDQGEATKDVRYEVKFSALCGNPVDRNTLLHRLAATTLIQEEQSKYEGDLELASDDVKAPIVSLSRSANVVSMVTSLVVVDQHSQQPIAPPKPTRKRQFQTFAQSAPGGRVFGLKAVNMEIPIQPSTNGVAVETSPPFFESETSLDARSPSSVPLSLSTTRTVGFTRKGSQQSPISPPQKVMAYSSNAPISPQEANRAQSSPSFTVHKTVHHPRQFNFSPNEPISPLAKSDTTTSEIIVPSPPAPKAKTSSSEIFVPGRRQEHPKGPVVVHLPMDAEDTVFVESENLNASPPYDSRAPINEPVSPMAIRRGVVRFSPEEPSTRPAHASKTTNAEVFVPGRREEKFKGPVVVTLPMDAEDAAVVVESYDSRAHVVEPDRSPMTNRQAPVLHAPTVSRPYDAIAATVGPPVRPKYQDFSRTSPERFSPNEARHPSADPPFNDEVLPPIVAVRIPNESEDAPVSVTTREARSPPTSPLFIASPARVGPPPARVGPPTARKPDDNFARRPDDNFAGRPDDNFARRPDDNFARSPDASKPAPTSFATRAESREHAPPPPPRKSSHGKRFAPPPIRLVEEEAAPQYSPPEEPFPAPPSPPAKSPPPRAKGLLSLRKELLSCQDPSGAWLLTNRLAGVCGTSLAELRMACPHGGGVTMETAWATALALCCLHMKFGFSKEEWEMVADKGSRWLANNLPPGDLSYVDILERADALLKVTLMYE